MSIQLQRRKFTVAEYARMGEAGIFAPDERVELIEGEVIPLSPHNRKHASRIARLTTVLVRAFGDSHEIRVQLPLTLGSYSEPEPDFALVPLDVADRAERHPGTADLILELSEASLSFDRKQKASLYARFGIPEYWVLNLKNHRLEVRRAPEAKPKAAFGWDYREVAVLASGQVVSPLFAPTREFAVGALLGLDPR